MNIGFLGLGIMGGGMAANLLRAGHAVTVWNRTKQKAAPLAEMGARVAQTPAEAAKEADVIITMLSEPRAVEATALGPGGFLDAAHPGGLWIDSSTVDPTFSRRMAAEAARRELRFLDAPVGGSKDAAAKGQLLFMVGADPVDLETARPLLEVMGRAHVHIGPVGMGSSLKIVNNMMAAQAMLAFSEGLVLAQAMGISFEQVFDFFTTYQTVVVSPLALGKRPKLESGNFEADFPLQWMQKDLELASLAAYEYGVAVPGANAAKAVYMLANRYGLGEADFSAVYAFLNQERDA